MGCGSSSAATTDPGSEARAQRVRSCTHMATVLEGNAVIHYAATGTLLSGKHNAMTKKSHDASVDDLQWCIRKYGLPTAALCPPGQCQLTDAWTKVVLLERYLNLDTMILTFGLPDERRPLNLPTCACVLARFTREGASEPVVRPYTPISTNAMLGRFQILIKAYENGIMTQYLACQLALGGTVDFKHTPDNVKVQYPFGRKHITMVAGGSGITPMIQALNAILGTPDDTTKVSLIYANKTKKDVICEGVLDTWASVYPDRLKVVHVISRESCAPGEDLPSSELRGHIGRHIIEQHSAPP